jgi:hypothetical protein
MRIGTFAVVACIFALGLAMWTTPSKAQGPLYDRVEVNLPYTVSVGDKTLQPGDYVIQQLHSNTSANRILLIYSDNGMKFETSAMTVPALDNATPDDTKVVLHHLGPDYYFDKIWIQGKNYGYEFPIPDSVKERQQERMEPVNVTAQYQAVPEPQQTAQNTTSESNTAVVAPPPSAQRSETETAQNTPPAPAPEAQPPAPAPAPEAQPPAPAPEAQAPATTQNNDQNSTANREMPATAAGWLGMLLSGGLLSGAGVYLKRRRS